MSNARVIDHKLALVSKDDAVTYRFRGPMSAYANCTLNNTIGELSISGDFGSWSYWWGTHGLGGRRFDEFIATCSDGYIAGKLFSGHRNMYEVDIKASNREVLKIFREYKKSGDLPRGWDNEHTKQFVAGVHALWSTDLDEYSHELSDLINNWDLEDAISEPWHLVQTRLTNAYLVLSEQIVPLLQRTIKDEMKAKVFNAEPMPIVQHDY